MPGNADESLDLSNVPCPQNAARALLKLEAMDPGQSLEIIIDEGEPYANLPPALEEDGYRILNRENIKGKWKLLVKKE